MATIATWRAENGKKPMPVAKAPPIDVFPVYDDPPGPIADDYIIDPDYPAKAYF